jgi:hypothetical protein
MNAIFRPPIIDEIDNYIKQFKVRPSKLRIKFNNLYWLVSYYYEKNHGVLISEKELREKLKEDKYMTYQGIKLITID